MPNYPIVTNAVQLFLEHTQNEHNADLVARYSRGMELQVNVCPGNDGRVSEEARNTYTNGILTWYNFRIPKKAMTDPEHSDWKIKWPLEEYADGVGCTGWNWEERKSLWVAYDFDSITEHAPGVGIEENDLIEVVEKAKNLPWVQVRKSTGGSGIHFYVYFDPDKAPRTQNHTEHAALARAILGKMSAEVGFDFQSKLDVCGSNMWIWHRKMTDSNEGFKILKPHEYELLEWPLNWKDHLPVITRVRKRILIEGVSEDEEESFDKLSNSRKRDPLDETHKALIEYLDIHSKFATTWNSDHHCLQTHTTALLDYVNDRIKKNDPIRGFYDTNSRANDPTKPNCFGFPMENGAWKVVRFGRGVEEAHTWQHDKENWTWCYFNRVPDLAMAASACEGLESANRGYVFADIEQARTAIKHLGSKLKLPEKVDDRAVALRPHKDGRLIVSLPALENDKEDEMRATGWVPERGKKWEQIFNVQTRITDSSVVAPEIDDVDGEVRAINTPDGESAGYMMKHISDKWTHQPGLTVKNYLKSRGYISTEADAILGDAAYRAWTKVCIPFGDEYPGNREWNKDAAQLRYVPADVEPTDIRHPHWDLVMAHCGEDLDANLAVSPWGKKYNVLSGRDFLTMWIACMIREPFEPLPYLFFFGDQNCGKSIFWESIELLCTKGVVQADNALTSTSGFNGELYESVLCYVEETDLSKTGTVAYNRIKEYVTNNTLSVHMKFLQPFMAPNTTHWVQMANSRDSLPILPGDTRIIIMYVQTLMNEIPKGELRMKLKEEAPHFMRTLMDIQLPPTTGRLRLPIINTSSKEAAEEANRDPLDQFIGENVFYAPGQKMLFKDFFERFHSTLQIWEQTTWPKRKVLASLPPQFPTAAGSGNKKYVGNASFDKTAVDLQASPLVIRDRRLV